MSYNNLRTGRISNRGHAYLVTTVTENRSPIFTDLYIGRIVINAMRQQDLAAATRTFALVVMPDHVHWLFSLGQPSLSAVVKRFKGGSAREINRRCGHSGPVWQPSFHDHAIRTEEALVDIARYVIQNPLRAGLVQRIGDYPLWNAVWL